MSAPFSPSSLGNVAQLRLGAQQARIGISALDGLGAQPDSFSRTLSVVGTKVQIRVFDTVDEARKNKREKFAVFFERETSRCHAAGTRDFSGGKGRFDVCSGASPTREPRNFALQSCY